MSSWKIIRVGKIYLYKSKQRIKYNPVQNVYEQKNNIDSSKTTGKNPL